MRRAAISGPFLFVAILAGSVGCSGNTNSPAESALGESCTKTADCRSGLVCLFNACEGAGERGLDASAGAGGSEGGIEHREGDAGGAGLSQIGETCQTTRDCGAGLACVPASGGASVCDVVSYGVTAGIKTCSGECGSATDCCALPVGVNLSGRNDAGAFVSVLNCEDILLVLLGGDPSICAGHPAAGTSAASACFFYQTYCSCPANTWECSTGRCVYAASCQGSLANTLGGCPTFTRTRSTLNTSCDLPGGKCRSAAVGCSADNDCEGAPVTDALGVTCRGGDCACSMGACYLKCAKDLDCQNGYSCNTTKKLCVRPPCSSDVQCFSLLGKARARCKSGVCGIPCTVDRDCSPSGDISGQPFNGTVCGSDGLCAPVGCTSDGDCAASTGPRLFCVAPIASDVHSAITN